MTTNPIELGETPGGALQLVDTARRKKGGAWYYKPYEFEQTCKADGTFPVDAPPSAGAGAMFSRAIAPWPDKMAGSDTAGWRRIPGGLRGGVPEVDPPYGSFERENMP